MTPDWLHQVSGADVWTTLVWVGAVIAGLLWVWQRAKALLARIEAKADRAVANTQPDNNGGHSPHDQLLKQSRHNAAAIHSMEKAIECLTGRVSDLTEHLDANHPGAVDPDTGRPVMPPPNGKD